MSGSNGLFNWLSQYPEIMAILVIAIGWVAATLVRLGLRAGILRLNKFWLRWSSRSEPLLTAQFTRFLQLLVYWGILLAAVIFAFSLLGDGRVTGWAEELWTVISRVLVALIIVATGHILGVVARRLVKDLGRNMGVAGLSRAVYAVIIAISLITAVNHLGLDITFITRLALVLITVFFAGLALAFGIGARVLVANLSAQGELQRYRVGDRIRADGFEGTVMEIHRTGVVLATSDGFARIPASKFAETTVIILRNEAEEDG